MKTIGTMVSVISLVSIGAASCSTTDTDVPVNIVSEDVSWKIDETTVTATVTRPDSGGIHPAIVLIAGSGPTDKDWTSPLLPGTNGSARLLAEELAKIGFVTIRYDKRVTGPYAQQNIPVCKNLANSTSLQFLFELTFSYTLASDTPCMCS